MSHDCPLCGRSFENERGVRVHKATGHGEPWMDKDTLEKEYVENGRSSYDLADEWGCDSKTVRNWLHRHGIELREAKDYHRVERVHYGYHTQGYEIWKLHYGDDRGKSVAVHRLLAVAKYGIDAVKDKHVHHKISIPWLNTYDNIELMDESEHAKMHYENGDLELQPGGPEELQNEL